MSETEHPVLKPLTLKTAAVVFKLSGALNTDDFSDHIGEVTVTPKAATSFTAINGKSITASTYDLTFGLVQDTDPTGFLRWLFDNEGSNGQVLVTFENGTDPMLAQVAISAAAVGGRADGSVLQSSVTLTAGAKPAWSAGLVLV